jgi:radical SAM superfamily enzyme YgiQ (UPF0313 family)
MVAAASPRGVEVSLCDDALEEVDFDARPDLVGLTANTAQAPRAYEIAAEFRARGVPVVMGGMHASALPDEALQHVDAVVVGEAEGIWHQVLADFRDGGPRGVYRSEQFPSLDNLAWPRRDLINQDAYLAGATVQATRGCPHNCDFCSVSTFFGRRQRLRPVDQVIDEIQHIDAERVILVDDNIMGRPSYAAELFDRLADLKTKWLSQASTTMLEKVDLIKHAGRAGCEALFVGLESIIPENLKAMGKSFNVVDKYRNLVDVLHEHGISIIGSFMFGLDHDDESVFERTVQFTEDAQIDLCLFSILTPLPGTAVYRRLEAEGRIFERDWSKYDATHATFRPNSITPERLESGLRWIYQRFYSWRSILRRTARRLKPIIWAINEAYRRRVQNWLKNS